MLVSFLSCGTGTTDVLNLHLAVRNAIVVSPTAVSVLVAEYSSIQTDYISHIKHSHTFQPCR